MGHERMARLLKRSDEYGKLELHRAKFVPNDSRKKKEAKWDKSTFANKCAGCHATAIDAESRAFSSVSLDCYVCHGSVDLNHTKRTELVLFSKQNRSARNVISICGQCHLRGGKSKSSGLPYPNTFVAGDNLLRDFQVDLSPQTISRLSPIEQHIFQNARDVAIGGHAELSCVSCHDIHSSSSQKHQGLKSGSLCTVCHVPDSDYAKLRPAFLPAQGLSAHNRTCEY